MGRFECRGEKFTLYDMDLAALKKSLNDLRYEVEHGLYAKKQNITVNAWFETWITEYKTHTVKRGTIKAYRDSYNSYIKQPLGMRKLKDIRPEHIQKLYNDMNQEGFSRNTIELASVVLSGMYKQALKNKIVRENPVPLATLPRMGTDKERRVMTIEEQKTFLKYAQNSYCYDMILLALCTGMRSGELRGLEWNDLDFTNKIIRVTGTLLYVNSQYYKDTPKTPTSKRDIPMLDNVYEMLRARKKKQAELRFALGDNWMAAGGLENLVFTSENGRPINRNRLEVAINTIIDEINKDGIRFEHVTPHTWRHTFATRAIEQGMPPQVLKTILGHSKLSMTMDLYSHVMPNTKAEEMQKLSDLF